MTSPAKTLLETRDRLLDDLHLIFSRLIPILELASVFARREPTDFPKCQREVSLTRESATVCNLRNAHIRFAEQSSGALYSSIQHIAMRRHARGRVKCSEEMTAAVANCRREFLKGKRHNGTGVVSPNE